jgi:hypothetical protein
MCECAVHATRVFKCHCPGNVSTDGDMHLVQNVDAGGLSYRLVDAKGQVVGRLAAQLAVILQVSYGAESSL